MYATGIAIIKITQNMGNSPMMALAEPVMLRSPDEPVARIVVTCA